MRKTLLVATLLAASALRVQAQTTSPAISVENAWARATTPSAKSGAVFLTIVDHGAPDELVSLSTPIAGKAELHQTTMQGNIMHMGPVGKLPVTNEGPVTFAPGGYHVMLMELKQPLQQGQSFPLTLNFAHAGAVQTSVIIESAGAGGPVQSGGPGHDMNMPMHMQMSPPPKS
jgi:copper(I)-binding protein